MPIKCQSEVRLHTGRSVHFHPSRFARPSFSILQWAPRLATWLHDTCVQYCMGEDSAEHAACESYEDAIKS